MCAEGLGALRIVRADFFDFRYILVTVSVDSILGFAVWHAIVVIARLFRNDYRYRVTLVEHTTVTVLVTVAIYRCDYDEFHRKLGFP